MKSSVLVSGIRDSIRARAAPKQLCTPYQGDILSWRAVAFDVEGVGVGEGVAVSVSRTDDQQHWVTGGDGRPMQVYVFEGVPDEVLRRRFVSQQFLHCGRYFLRSSNNICHWSGNLENATAALSDEFGDGFGSTTTQEAGKCCRLRCRLIRLGWHPRAFR